MGIDTAIIHRGVVSLPGCPRSLQQPTGALTKGAGPRPRRDAARPDPRDMEVEPGLEPTSCDFEIPCPWFERREAVL